MKTRTARRWTWFAVICLALLGLAVWAGVWLTEHVPEHVTLVVDGEGTEIEGLHGMHWLMAGLGVLIAALVVLVVVPLALLFGLGVPLLVVAGVLVVALVCAGLLVALALSPLLLVGLGIWWLVRDRKPASTATTGTTIEA